jgi:hypothetical protein
MPDLSGCNHLIAYLFEVGPISQGGAGEGPITWGELNHWQAGTCRLLTPWEKTTLRVLSQEYLSELHAAVDPNRPAPLIPAETLGATRVAVDKALRNQFRSFIEARKK